MCLGIFEEHTATLVDGKGAETAEHGADHVAHAAGQQRAADDGGGNGVHFCACGDAGIARGLVHQEDEAGQTAQQARNEIGHKAGTLDVDAQHQGALLVAAHGVNITAQTDVAQHQIDQNDHANGDDGANAETGRDHIAVLGGVAQEGEFKLGFDQLVKVGVGDLDGIDGEHCGQTAGKEHARERDDEGLDLHIADEEAMQRTEGQTDAERQKIHDVVDSISGDPGAGVYSPKDLDHTTLVGGLATGSSYNSISYGSSAAGGAPAAYPFRVPNTEKNNNEGDRKAAKYAWVVQLAKDLGFENVVQRQDDKYVYVEIGDPDAPEMVMALSHLDSPTAANNATGNLTRWKNAAGDLDQTAYYNPYVRDGWIYGTGVQDDSGPCLATLYAAKALMDAGLPMDRRIRIVMGSYEDSNPGVPTVANTLNYMDIPYYTANPSFYDNWAYKSLNREETPIAAYTSDSRFPVIIGNTQNLTNKVLGMDLSADMGKAFGLQRLSVNATLREGDPTLEDIVYGSAAQVASRAYFVLDAAGVSAATMSAFTKAVKNAAVAQGWSYSTEPNIAPTLEGGVANPGRVNNVSLVYDETADTITIDINTDVAMEYPTPHYAPNAVVWGMYLLSQALPAANAGELKLMDAAEGLTDLFFQNGVEGEAYIGKYILDADMLRNEDNGAPNLTIAIGYISNKDLGASANAYYNTESGELQLRLGVRSLYTTKELYEKAAEQFMTAIQAKGFDFYTLATNGNKSAAFTAYSNPTLYLTHDNPLTALQFQTYKATMQADPEAFDDVIGLLDISAPIGTTGGTLASNYRNKMTAFGAIIPGNERWWHSANERISVKSIIQMTKLMADGMLEMARYSGPAGAQLMWADIDGLNANRAELDLLDVTVGTYVDASDKVTAEALNGATLLGATSFEIPMWVDRGNTTKSDAVYKLGHEAGGVYLPLDNQDYVDNTFVMPMRLEFKVEKPADVSDLYWNHAIENNFDGFTFNIMQGDKSIPLTLKDTDDASDYYSIRVDGDSVYVAVNLAIVDGTYNNGEITTVVADSKTDLYDLNDEWEAANGNPFPERGKVEERGFFIVSDGEKDAEFHSPDAIYVTLVPEETHTVTFVYPEGIKDSETTVELYKGFPTSSSSTLETMIKNKQLVAIAPAEEGNDSVYVITEPGTYSYHISGEGYYNILKLVNITEEDLYAGNIEITAVGGKLGTRADEEFSDGYQPTVKPEKAPDSYKMDARDAMLVIWTDEILEHFTMDSTTQKTPYTTTPAFDGKDAAHEVTSQEELMNFVKDRDSKCDYMHLYSAGTTPNYKFDIPMAIFTNSEIPAGATVEEAAAILKASGKTSVWYQTQIHPNEPASGEAALVIIDRFINDPETRALLDDINLIIVPRINPDGSYLFSRATYEGFDMNRDHMSLKAAELAQLHTAYRLFMSEVVIDGHEFTFYGANTAGFMNNADDVETTPATSLNHDANVTKLALGFSGQAFEDATNAGLRIYHYGTTVNNPIGRAYFGLYNCLSFLVETRGIGAGRTNFERRVFSQETVIMSYITSAAKHADEVKSVVAEARAKTIEMGKTYDENNLLGLYQTASGKNKTEYASTRYQFNMDGTRHENASYENVALNLNDTLSRSRVRPTAYVIPADAANIDKILYIMENQGAEYYELPAGAVATLEQYYYVGQRQGARNALDIVADLRDAATVTFENGAYVFPMDQVAANVIAMLVEPDVTDSVGYDGSLFQYGVVTYDATTKDFPLYRYTGNDPRTTLDGKQLLHDCPSKNFVDVSATAWYHNAVDFVVGNKLMVGIAGNAFAPNEKLTRAMIVQILWAKEGNPATEEAASFTDVAEGKWYSNAVAWAGSAGIVAGYTDGRFGPNDNVTREQLAAILYRYAQYKGVDVSMVKELTFVDSAAISAWAAPAVRWACGQGIINGRPGNVMDPAGTATRAEAAQMLMMLCAAIDG